MDLYLHDDKFDDRVTGNMRRPTHAGTQRNIVVDYEYQLEMLIDEIASDYPEIVVVESSGGRWWKRQGNGRFVASTPEECTRWEASAEAAGSESK
jgi:hypothetical protein